MRLLIVVGGPSFLMGAMRCLLMSLVACCILWNAYGQNLRGGAQDVDTQDVATEAPHANVEEDGLPEADEEEDGEARAPGPSPGSTWFG